LYKMCRTEASANRQRSLEQGLLDAMQVMDFAEISICDLCDQLQIPRKAFYRYFSGKEGALYALIDHTLMQFELKDFIHQDRAHASALYRLEDYFQFWKEQSKLLYALVRNRRIDLLVERSVRHAITEANVTRRMTEYKMDRQDNYAIMFAVCGLLAMTVEWYRRDYKTPVQEMARIAGKLLTKPIFPEA